MKKIYLSIITALAGLSLNAQTLTDANHSPAAGDSHSSYQCDSTGITAGAAGAGALWNYSTIVTHSSVVSNFTTAANANASYPIPGVQVASVLSDMSFYKSTTSDLKYYGGNIVVGPVSAALIYTTAAIVAAYPMSLNTTSSSVTGGTINVTAPLAQAGTFTGNSSTIADGTGTLALASGTFNTVVRVVTTQTISFTTPLTTGTVTQKNYNYYNVGVKESLFSISTSTVITSLSPSASTQTIVTRNKPAAPLAVNENSSALVNLVVFPNPSNTTVTFATENAEAKQVVIFDVTGKLVEKQNLTEGKLKLDVSNYTTGLYMYSVIGNANQTLKSGKITVSH